MLKRAAVLLGALALAGCTPPLEPEDKARLDEAFATGFDLDVLRYDWDEARAEQTERGLGDVLGQLTTVPFQLSNPQMFLTTGRARAVIDRELKARNLPKHSLAGASALLFGAAWELANQKTLEPWQNTALLNQSAAMLRSSYRGAGDRRRQMEADARLNLAALWLEEARIRQGDPAAMSALSEAVHRDMVATGNDLRGQIVTEDGFADRPAAGATP